MESKRDVIDCGAQFLGPSKAEAAQQPPKKKKLSLFAQKMLQQKQGAAGGAGTQVAGAEKVDGFPKVPKMFGQGSAEVEAVPSVQETQQPPQTQPSQMTNLLSNLPNAANNEDIHQENVRKLMGMTAEEIRAEQESLKALFTKDQLDMLRKLGQPKAPSPGPQQAAASSDAAKKPKVLSTSQSKYQSGNHSGLHPPVKSAAQPPRGLGDLQKQIAEAKKPLGSGEDFGRAVKRQNDIDNEIELKMDCLRVSESGQITFSCAPQASDDAEMTEINYAESMDLDDFINIHDKQFSLQEILALLQSTYPQHKIFILRIINNMLKRPKEESEEGRSAREFVFQHVLDPQKTSLLRALAACAQVTRMDFVSVLIEVWDSIQEHVFGKTADVVCEHTRFHLLRLRAEEGLTGPYPWQFWLMEFTPEMLVENLREELAGQQGGKVVTILCQKLFAQPLSSQNMLLYRKCFRLVRVMTQLDAHQGQTFNVLLFKWLASTPDFFPALLNLAARDEDALACYRELVAVLEGVVVRGGCDAGQVEGVVATAIQTGLELLGAISQAKLEEAGEEGDSERKMSVFSELTCLFRARKLIGRLQGAELEKLNQYLCQFLENRKDDHAIHAEMPQLVALMSIVQEETGQQNKMPSLGDEQAHQVVQKLGLRGLCKHSFLLREPAILNAVKKAQKEQESAAFAEVEALDEGTDLGLLHLCKMLSIYPDALIERLVKAAEARLRSASGNPSGLRPMLSLFVVEKAYLWSYIQSKAPSSPAVLPALALVPRLLSSWDQSLWLTLANQYLFPGEPWAVLRQFGFCVIKEDPSGGARDCFRMIERKSLQDGGADQVETMLPLTTDWFFRPMFYINSPDQKLQGLVQTMFRYLQHLHSANPRLLPLFGVHSLQGIQLMAYLACQALSEPANIPESEQKAAHPDIILNQESLRHLDDLQQTLIMATLEKGPETEADGCPEWLLRTYAQIFQLSSFYEELSQFFNCYPPEMSKALFKTLLFAIVHEGPKAPGQEYQLAQSSDPKREFINSLTDIVPCIVRWEIEEPLDPKSPFVLCLLKQIDLKSKEKSNDPSRFFETCYQRIMNWLQINMGVLDGDLESRSLVLQCLKSLV